MTNLPEMPSDATLLRVLHCFDEEGYTSQFQLIGDGLIRCLTCRSEIAATSADGNRIVRLEGVSDPDDMLAVLPVECPVCQAHGVIVANYGPEATIEDAEFLLAVERHAGADEELPGAHRGPSNTSTVEPPPPS